MIKAKPWNGKDLKGTWEVTLKIDGVRALWKPTTKTLPTSRMGTSVTVESGYWVSRAGKPLYNIPKAYGKALDCEVYLGNFKDTIRAVRTPTPKNTGCKLKKCKCRNGEFAHLDMAHRDTCKNWREATPRILPEHLYSLDPLDRRLDTKTRLLDPTAPRILHFLDEVVRDGYEGLVLRQGDKWLKVKPEETHDVLVTGAIEGTGKHTGRLGALLTAKGGVGTGFSDKERHDLWVWHLLGDNSEPGLVGSTIEVSCMHFTPDGMFRHPRFIRLRPDKIAEE